MISDVVPKWFTRKELLHLFKQLDGKTTRETVYLKTKVGKEMWRTNHLPWDELIYLGLLRMTNILHRKIMMDREEYWLVVSPKMCRHEYWPLHVFHDYKEEWVKKPWQSRIKEEVSPGVL